MTDLTRRSLLRRGAALVGCSAAAHPLMTTVTFAQAPWDARLVVIVLRGAMDGLDVVRPVGDLAYAALRGELLARQSGAPVDLDGYWQLHPALAPLAPLVAAGELGAVHAVSTPYRDKRSHFDGQDLLEAGTGMDVAASRVRDGWLNRLLQSQSGLGSRTAYAVGRDDLRILDGRAPVANWAPEVDFSLTPQARLLLDEIYHADPLFRDAANEAIELADLADTDEGDARGKMLVKRMASGREDAIAAYAASRLYDEARIAAFSISGWDTHRKQHSALTRTLTGLSKVILTLRDGLGEVWNRTAVLAVTEFGRTVRLNGSAGTDHGTGGAMLIAGGALRGGRVFGRWPGLGAGDLYADRDLTPTADVRAYAAWALRGLYGIDRATLEGTVFPGLDMGDDPHLVA